jgi:superoxide dismutase, Fe-Mn family
MSHTAKNYDHLIGSISGLSEKQLRAHFELYQGYVKKLNEIEERLKTADPKTANYSYGEISELMRRRSVAYNGTFLHELFFENINEKKTAPSQELKMAIDANFGSPTGWLDQLRAGLLSTPGWVLLTRSRQNGALRTNLLGEHHIGVLVEQDIILAFDGWEHAYFIDYATKKTDYINTLVRCTDWNIAINRFEASELMTRAAA